jgi:hypothetical protein
MKGDPKVRDDLHRGLSRRRPHDRRPGHPGDRDPAEARREPIQRIGLQPDAQKPM